MANPFLQDIKEKGGLYDYAFQCDEETNTPVVIDHNEMIARVFVKPTKTAEVHRAELHSDQHRRGLQLKSFKQEIML